MLLAFFNDPNPWGSFERCLRIRGWAVWAWLIPACESWPLLTGYVGHALAHSSPLGFLCVDSLQTVNLSFALAPKQISVSKTVTQLT